MVTHSTSHPPIQGYAELNMKWIIGGLMALFAVLLVLLVLNGFGDVPCQDGVWDAAKQTCVPS